MTMHTSRRAPKPERNGSAAAVSLKWEAPPKKAGGRRSVLLPQVRSVLPQVKAKPGVWARILTYDNRGGAAAARKRLADAFPEFEFVQRSVLDEGVSAVYVRFPA